MRKVPITRKALLCRWQVPTPRLMSNPKQIRKERCDGEPALLWLAPCLRRPPRLATSFNGSLECIRSRRLRRRPRRPAAGAEQHDEPPVRTTAAEPSQFAYDRSITSIL